MNSETSSKESDSLKDEKAPVTEIVTSETVPPVKKKKHNGHEYKPECKCARCKKVTEKGIHIDMVEKQFRDAFEMQKADFIKQHIDNLPKDELLLKVNESNISLMLEKIEILKSKYSGMKYSELMYNVINSSLTNYLKSL